MTKRKIIRLTESDIVGMVKRSVKKAIRETLEANGDEQWDGLIKLLLPQVREKLDNVDFSEGRDWDEDNSFGVDDELEFYGDELDLGEYSDILEDVTVRCEAYGGAAQTYYRSADYYNPEESSGSGEVKVTMVGIDLYKRDGTEDTIDTNILVGTYDLSW